MLHTYYEDMKRGFIIAVIICLATLSSFAENNKTNSIKGKVVDYQGEPIVGATVYVEETNTIVYTDFDGEFLIKNPSKDKTTITVKMISFNENKSIVLNSEILRDSISIKLFSK